MRKLSLGGFVQICWWCGWSVEWWWVGFCQFVGDCLGLLGCEIWRFKFHSTGFEFNFLGFKFAGFAFLFKYIMCSCLIYQFYLGLFFSHGFYYFFGFMGLICCRIRWRKGILNEFLYVYLLRKCNKRKENIDYFNFLGNLHVLSQRT